MKIFTPQMLNTFVKCPREYFYKFEKNISSPQLDSNFLVGKNIHAISAYYLKGEDISCFYLSDIEKNMWNNIQTCSFFRMKAKMVESNVSVKIGEYWIGGRLDALVEDVHGKFFILDYKTGEIPKDAETNFQTIIYLLCCDKLLQNYNELSFVYISAKTGTCKVIAFNDDLKEKFEYEIRSVCDTINATMQTKNRIKGVSKNCLQCQYNKICVS